MTKTIKRNQIVITDDYSFSGVEPWYSQRMVQVKLSLDSDIAPIAQDLLDRAWSALTADDSIRAVKKFADDLDTQVRYAGSSDADSELASVEHKDGELRISVGSNVQHKFPFSKKSMVDLCKKILDMLKTSSVVYNTAARDPKTDMADLNKAYKRYLHKEVLEIFENAGIVTDDVWEIVEAMADQIGVNE